MNQEEIPEITKNGGLYWGNSQESDLWTAKSSETRNMENRKTLSEILGFKNEVIWSQVVWFSILHVLFAYSVVTFPFLSHKMTTIWMLIVYNIGLFGSTGGAHRYWSHRSFKAKLPLRIILFICYCTNGQFSYTIYQWALDHRVHHKYSDTDEDPHNSKRGFFFCHMGWLLMKSSPQVIKRHQQVYMTDIKKDEIVMFGEKYYIPLSIFFAFILPISVPVYLWNEEWKYAITAITFIGYPMMMHSIASINSLAHLWGFKPYDKSIAPAENYIVAVAAIGEGWHNYHHAFPYDYKAAEIGYYRMNLTAFLIDMFAKIGWAYDLKTASEDLVKTTMKNKGDGTKPFWYKDVPENLEE